MEVQFVDSEISKCFGTRDDQEDVWVTPSI